MLENSLVYKIQYVYIEFKSKAEAEKVYAERKEILKKTEGTFEPLYESPEHFIARLEEEKINLENVIVIYKPSTSLRISDSIPSKSDRCTQLHSLLCIVSGLDKENIRIIPSMNRVTGKYNADQIFVILPSRADVQKIFISQPFFKNLIADKLIHLNYYSELKCDPNMCARCSLPLVSFGNHK